MKLIVQGSRRGRPLWMALLVTASIWLSVNAVVPAGSVGGNPVELQPSESSAHQDRRKAKGKSSKVSSVSIEKGTISKRQSTTRTGSRERTRQHSRGTHHASTRSANACRCEYPDEGIYARRALKSSDAKSQPKTKQVSSSRVSTSYTVVKGVTVLPPTFRACQGVVYVCADTYFDGPLWKYDCSGRGTTDFVGYVVVIPNDYFLCKCETSSTGSQFDVIPGVTSSPTTSYTVAVSSKGNSGSKAKSTKQSAGGIFASKGSGKAGKRRLNSDGPLGNHRTLKGDKGGPKDASKGARDSTSIRAKSSSAYTVYAPSPTKIRFYPPIKCSVPRPSSASVSPTTTGSTFSPTKSPAPSSSATGQPTTHIIAITEAPSTHPTLSTEPSTSPTALATPTLSPTSSEAPTIATGTPTVRVIAAPPPTAMPTKKPVPAPYCPPGTKKPSTMPTFQATSSPTTQPTAAVVAAPTPNPTNRPTTSTSPSSGPSYHYIPPYQGVPDRPEYNLTTNGTYFTKAPSPHPTLSPTISPTTLSPTTAPTAKVIPVTAVPSATPSYMPSSKPIYTPEPTKLPTHYPTISTLSPTYYPTISTLSPTTSPTAKVIPVTAVPSASPSEMPSAKPVCTPKPTPLPTHYPTFMTSSPTTSPTVRVIPATLSPTKLPTPYPTPPPTAYPTPRPTFATGKPSASPSRDEDIPSGTWFPTMDFYDVNEQLTCIAVVDDIHVSAEVMNSTWAQFRKDYPLRSFCLLQPMPDQKPELGIPAAFEADPKAFYFQVNRDYGVAASAADWFEICGLSGIEKKGITKVALAIDTPQLYSATYVRAAYELFLTKIAASRVALVQAPVGPDENWVSPFLQTFL